MNDFEKGYVFWGGSDNEPPPPTGCLRFIFYIGLILIGVIIAFLLLGLYYKYFG